MRRGRSESGMGRCSPICIVFRLRERCRCDRHASQGNCVTAITETSISAKSSLSVCFECSDTTLHDSAQESQPRGSDDSVSSVSSVSSGHFSRSSQGHLLGHLSDASCDFSCPGTPHAALDEDARSAKRRHPHEAPNNDNECKNPRDYGLCNAFACVNESQPHRRIRVVTN